MSREGILSVKEKWALDSQLGELLRGLDTDQKPTASLDEAFSTRLEALMADYKISIQDAVEIVSLL